ncbi:hypothetical protein ACHAXT_011769 [Thalassiosira profunda]
MAKSRGGGYLAARAAAESSSAVVPPAPPTAVAIAADAVLVGRGHRRPFRRKISSLASLLAVAVLISLASSCFQGVSAGVAPLSGGHLRGGPAAVGERRRLSTEEGDDGAQWEDDDDDDDAGVAVAAEEAGVDAVPAPPMGLPEPAAKPSAIAIEAEEKESEEEAAPAIPTVANLAPAAAQAGILLGKHWPPGCTYQCFVGRYPDLSFENEEVALEKFMEKATVEKWDCTCAEGGAAPSSEDEGEGQDEGESASDPLAEEDVFEELEEVQEELEELEGRTDADDEVEEEIEELEELEGELIEEVMEEAAGDDDEWVDDEVPETAEDLEEEIEEIEGEIQAIESIDDDGEYAQEKAEDLAGLEEWEEEVKEELKDEVMLENMLNGTTLEGLNVDPSLTMDWTTLNPPDETAEESENVGEDNRVGDEDPKEAESPPLNIDTEPDRMHGNDAVVAGEVKEAKSETEQIDVEPEREGDFDTEPAAVAAKAEAQENVAAEAGNETEAVVPPPGDDTDEEPKGEGETATPTQKAATQSPTEGKGTSSPTQKPTSKPTTAAPTVEYVEPSEASDPLEKEESEAFKDGEEAKEDDGAMPWDDDAAEEPTPNNNKEFEEEAKKVGGWLSLASIILMIYTAYQMSENPDGICASLCRLVITVIGCIIKIMLVPFKYVMGGGRPSGGHCEYHMSTPDYRDPYGSRHMELT